jgi:hypothetical protein
MKPETRTSVFFVLFFVFVSLKNSRVNVFLSDGN